MSNKPILVFESPAFTRSGYGDWAIAIGKSLLRYNRLKDDMFDIHVIPTQWGACSKKNLESELLDPDGKEMLNKILRTQLPRQPDIYIKCSIPNEFMSHGKYNIGITAGIESTVPPAPWIEGLNRMNLNFVLSQHVKDVFAGANYTKKNPNGSTEELVVKSPMEILHWGANTKSFKKTDEKNALVEETLKDIPETFAFMFVGQWTHGNIRADRKAIGYLIKTFLEAFANVENPPALILKTSGAQLCVMDRYDCINKINDVTHMVKASKGQDVKLPNVYLLHGELNDVEMNALYNHEKVKVHVSFTHGEGGGHPLLLSTLSGKPLLAPRWSGHLDYLNPKYSNFFDGALAPIPDEALNDWFVKEARWFDVDQDAAGLKMKHYFQHYSPRILADAEALRAENAVKFSEETIDKEFHAMLDKHLPKFAVQAPINLPPLKKLNLPKKAAPVAK